MQANREKTADLLTFTREILHEKLEFFFSCFS